MRHPVVSREDWLKAREPLLAKEKALMKAQDRLAEDQRALPWVRIDKDYELEGPDGKLAFSDLFAGRSQLFLKHFMLSPEQTLQCVGCSLEVDHMTDLIPHLENHDVSYAVVARAAIEDIEAMRRRMGWRCAWVSSLGTDFSRDMALGFGPEGRPAGNQVFFRDEEGQIFQTYATYGRGGEAFLGIYRIFDLTPKGRNETGPHHTLADWARPRTEYGKGGEVAANGRYHPPACGCRAHDAHAA